MGSRWKSGVPKNWPESIPYLSSPIYSRRLTKAQLDAIRNRPTGTVAGGLAELPSGYKPGPSTSVRIVPIADPRHPAFGQSGLFAARDLAPGELVVAYVGEVHPGGGGGGDDGPDARSDYDLWLDRAADVAVDAAGSGNEARFVNDYRGVPGQQRPNAEFREVWDPRRLEKGMAVFVLPAGKRAVGKARTVGIAKGQEILVSYGKGFWKERLPGEEETGEARAAN